MNEHTLSVLEYHRLLELLATQARSAPGKALARALRPSPRVPPSTEAAAGSVLAAPGDLSWRRPLWAALLAMERGPVPAPSVSYESPAAILKRAAPSEAVLDPMDFVELGKLLAAVAELRQVLQNLTRPANALANLAVALAPCGEFARRLAHCFDPDGRVRDDATPKLAELRRRRASLERRIVTKLEGLFEVGDLEDSFQERFVALRSDRFVVPVRRERRSRLRGVVHDQSNSGRTLFIEPEMTVEDGNELAALRLEERDEIRRLLGELSDQVRVLSPSLAHNDALLAEYDLARAIARWADQAQAEFPLFGPHLELLSARHPLLWHRLCAAGQEGALVPLSLSIGEGYRGLVITGANTGGKTVVLKTIGLLTLMAQTGLPITADAQSRIRVFPAVLADIGDEQSIEQNLSTYSGHLRQVREILAASASQPCLVLLDELGAGTDPVEGGALGCAVLEALAERPGLTLSSTHLSMIKQFVGEHQTLMNGAMSFDHETLQPTYHLELGRPGASHALAIAERAGLPAAVLARARHLMGTGQARLESLLTNLDERERQQREDLAATTAARDEARQQRDSLRKELETLRRQRRDLLHQAQNEAAAMVENTRRELDRLLRETREQGPASPVAKEARREVEVRREALREQLQHSKPKPAQGPPPRDPQPGQTVWVEALQGRGKILSRHADGKRLTVQVGAMTVEVKLKDLAQAGDAAPTPAPAPPPPSVPRDQRGASRSELNLIGEHLDTAEPRLARFLDEAIYGGLLELRIIHGMGTGALKNLVHEQLKTCRAVASYHLGVEGREPGGAGCTWVKLKE